MAPEIGLPMEAALQMSGGALTIPYQSGFLDSVKGGGSMNIPARHGGSMNVPRRYGQGITAKTVTKSGNGKAYNGFVAPPPQSYLAMNHNLY